MVNDEIREMTRRFVEVLHPVKIILFGSYAKDTYREDSDYDFYIIMPDEATEQKMFDATTAAYWAIDSMRERKAVDILMHTQSHFEYRKTHPTMEKVVDREGVVLYG